MVITITCTYYFLFKNISDFSFRENTFLIIGLLSLGVSWSFIKNKNSFKEIIIALVIGPYLLTSFFLQSGLFTDRSREIRETMEHVSSIDIVKNQYINVIKSGKNNTESQSKIIRISLLTPNLGIRLNKIKDLRPGELAWSKETSDKIMNDNSYEILYENDTLKPWKLILKR